MTIFPIQINCFNVNIKFWKFLGIWPTDTCKYYSYYSKVFVIIFVILYDLLYTVNFYFLPRNLDYITQEMVFYFTEVSVASKVFTFYLMHENILRLFLKFQSEDFQPTTNVEYEIINKAKKFNVKYWRIVAAVSITSTIAHVWLPLITHLFNPVKLDLVVCSYSFLSDELKEKFIYPLYLYQGFGMLFHLLYNVNIDTFFLGLMVLNIAQLDILNVRLKNVTNVDETERESNTKHNQAKLKIPNEHDLVIKLNKSIIHFEKVNKFCSLIQQVFSVTLFVQFSMASCIICACLFRFTLPAPIQYYIFLATYMFVMIIQILVPCWFGTRIMDKSTVLARAVYDCDWPERGRCFKSNLRFFVDRTSCPLSITGLKMFPLSLGTFTSIMNSAYSFFTLLRHMQTRQ